MLIGLAMFCNSYWHRLRAGSSYASRVEEPIEQSHAHEMREKEGEREEEEFF